MEFFGDLSGFEILIYLIQTVIFVITVIAGVWGVNQWKAQLKYNAHFDLARRLALLAYKFDDALEFAQSPAEYKDESQDRPKNEDETRTDESRLNSRYVRLKRLIPLQEILQEMRVANLESKVTIGQDFQSYIDKYINAYTSMKIAIITIYDPRFEQQFSLNPSAKDELLAQWEKADGIIFGHGEGEILRKTVNQNTDRLVEYLSKYTFRK